MGTSSVAVTSTRSPANRARLGKPRQVATPERWPSQQAPLEHHPAKGGPNRRQTGADGKLDVAELLAQHQKASPAQAHRTIPDPPGAPATRAMHPELERGPAEQDSRQPSAELVIDAAHSPRGI